MSDNVNRYYCLIGRDDKDVEQRELSAETTRLFTEKLHTLNNTNFLLKVRDLFINTKRGEFYSEHGTDNLPRTFFYCPLPLTTGVTRDVAAVWGECGIYSGGREFRYSHYYMENFNTLDPHTLICKLFTSKYCDEGEITEILSHNPEKKGQPDLRRVITFDPDFVKEISDRCRNLVSAVAEKLCEGKTVIIRLSDGNDFNRDAKDIVSQIMSMLPGDFRRQVGFITYLQADQIKRFRDQSNNIRLIVVDSDVNVSEFENIDPFAVFTYDKDYIGDIDCREDFLEWSRIEFADRERQIAQFAELHAGEISSTREILPKMIEVYHEAENFADSFADEEVENCSTPEELARYFNKFDICRIVPRARQSFIKEIPRMLPDGVSLEEMLLEALRCGDERRKRAARFCLFNFVKEPSKLIGPIERSVEKAYSAGSERQLNEDRDKINSLETRVKELTAESERRVNELKSECEKRVNELKSDYETRISGLTSDYESQISELRSEYEKRINDLTSDYETRIDELKNNYEKRIGELTGEYEKLRAAHDERGEKLSALESERDKLYDVSEHLKVEIARLEGDLKSEKSETETLRGNIKELNAKLDDAESRYSVETEKNAELNKAIESLKADYEKKLDEIADINEKLRKTNTELSESRTECEVLRNLKERLEKELSEEKTKTDELQKALEEKDRAAAQLRADIEAKNAEIADVKSKLDVCLGKLSEAESRIESQSEQIRVLAAERDRVLKELDGERQRAVKIM